MGNGTRSQKGAGKGVGAVLVKPAVSMVGELGNAECSETDRIFLNHPYCKCCRTSPIRMVSPTRQFCLLIPLS